MYEAVHGPKLAKCASTRIKHLKSMPERNLCWQGIYISSRVASSQKENQPVKEKSHNDLFGSTLH